MVAQLSSHWTGLWPDCFTEPSVEHLVLQILSALLNLDLHKSWINVQVLSTLSNYLVSNPESRSMMDNGELRLGQIHKLIKYLNGWSVAAILSILR